MLFRSWKKEATTPFALKKEKPKDVNPVPQEVEVDLTPARRKRIEDYLKSVQQPEPKESWEQKENQRVSEILGTFDQVKVDSVEAKQKPVKPQLTTRVRKLPANPQKPVEISADQEVVVKPT